MRILHFSDFHLNGNQLKRAETIVERIIDALVPIHNEKPINLILFSGDLVNEGGTGFSNMQDAFNKFVEIVIEPIVTSLNIPQNRFIFTLGNHDINRTIIDKVEDKRLAESLTSLNNVDNYLHQPKLKIHRISEFNSFRDLYWQEHKGDAEINSTPFQYCIKLEIEGTRVGINCLNTVWRCTGEETNNGKLILGKCQITEASKFLKDCDLKFAIGHHHTLKLQEFEKNTINGLMAQHYDVFFCGHTHDSDGEFVERPQGYCFFFTSPGTSCKNVSAEPKYRNGFRLIDHEQKDGYVDAHLFRQDDNEDFKRDMNYGNNGIWHEPIYSHKIIQRMDVSLLKKEKGGDFLCNEVIEDCINKLRDETNKTIQLIALSGLGKTRILQETFDYGQPEHKNHFYCELFDNRASLMYDVINILQNGQEKGIIILDNCPNDLFEEVIIKRNEYNPSFRLIGVNNEVYDYKNMSSLNVQQIILTQKQMYRKVDEYIDTNTSIDMSVREKIKKIADGFPCMAIRLIDECRNSNDDVNIHKVDHIVRKLLKFDDGDKGEVQKKVLATLALFQPFPYGNKNAFKFIRENKNITNIFHKDTAEIRCLFHQIINKYDNFLVEISGSWLTIRPFPLAIWLIEEWFKDVDEERMEEIIADLQHLDEPTQTIISNGLCKRLEYMQDSIEAQDLIQQLSSKNGLFCNEKIVCSDLGSRLILAMSSVNPVAVAKCLYNIFRLKDINWVRDNVCGNVRRNLVWALEKLCFCKESYGKAVKVMALFAAAENETWANNATARLKQLFHIMLPGTEATLEERMHTLRDLKDAGEQYKDLTLDCIDSAFDDKHFYRDNYASKVGLSEKKDYSPSDKEVMEYWKYCRDMLIEWLEKDMNIIDRVAKLLVSHTMRWVCNGMLERMFPLILKVSESYGNAWEDMYSILIRISRKQLSLLYSDEFLAKLAKFQSQVRPTPFCQKLKDVKAGHQYNKYGMSSHDTIEYERERYNILAKEFVDNQIYSSYEEVRQIVYDKEYHNARFSYYLKEIMTDEQLEKLLNIFLQLIKEQGEDNFKNSSFVFQICSAFRESRTLRNFIQEVYQAGYHKLYVILLSICETTSMLSYNQLKKDIQDGRLTEDVAPYYIQHVSPHDNNHIRKIMKGYHKDFPNNVIELMNFIINYQIDKDLLNANETLSLVKQVTLEYPIDNTPSNINYSYSQYVKWLLKEYHDEEYAIKFNKKMIKAMNVPYLHRNFDGIYSELLKDYRNVIWNDFEEAFVSDDYKAFYLQIKNEIGSGTSFGTGPLFQSDDNKIKEMCAKYPNQAPCRIAEMIPVFNYDDDEQRFSDWFLWLLDEYGDQDYVLDGLSTNINTFSWTNSVIPLLNKKKTCFEKIKNHKRLEVRKWVEQCENAIDEKLNKEKDNEAFTKYSYEL